MTYIFTHICADIAPELKEMCFSCFPDTDFGSTAAKFTSLLTNICKVTGADFVDGNSPKLQGSWHSIKDTYDLITSFILQQNIINLMPEGQRSLSTSSFHFESSRCTGTGYDRERERQRDPPQVTTHAVNDKFHSFVSTPDQTPVTDEKVGTVSSEHVNVHDPKTSTICDQPSSHSSVNRTVIDFQDVVNFDSLQDFDNDQQHDSLEDMPTSSALPTVQIKHEYNDDAYSNAHTSEPCKYTSNDNTHIPDQEYSQQQPPFVMQTEEMSMHTKMEEYEGGEGNGGAEDFLDHSSETPLYTTVSPTGMLTLMASESPSYGTTRLKKKLPKNSGSHEGHGDGKLKKMYVKQTSENGLSFICVHCKYSTYCLKNIEDHVRRNHSERLFHCSLCSTKFGLKRDLKRHYKVKHCVIIDNTQKLVSNR